MSISTILVANRGEIALRVFSTAKNMGLRCVAVYSEADANSSFVTAADVAVHVSGYLESEAIIAAAVETGADAIHPGYGFLSENADFARAVIDAGLIWIGPSPEVIESMGDKIAAKKAAVDANVPILPSSNDPSAGDEVGYPLLVKAAAGGGGKGMHVVEASGDLSEAVASAQREALKAFGDDRVFLERYVPSSHHIEIQILGDSHGNLVHLGERECSIQRRHQKIIEEAPSPTIDSGLRASMAEAALSLARTIGYESTGTVEFLLDHDSKEFFFLEVNTRLQVEHPVTEETTGIDLVRQQILVAQGEAIECPQESISSFGHSIEARLYAEDPANNFLPAIGTVSAFQIPDSDNIRWDVGIGKGTEVGVQFDPMLAKVTSKGSTRREAALRLAKALEELHLGGITTNREFLVSTLRHEAFLAGDTTTDFIERHNPASNNFLTREEVSRAAAVAALWIQGENRAAALVLDQIPSGWRNSHFPDQLTSFTSGEEQFDVSYHSTRDGSFVLNEVDSNRVHRHSSTDIDVEIAGLRSTHVVTRSGNEVFVQMERGTAHLSLVPRFIPPGSNEVADGLVSPMPGVVLDIRVEVGDAVKTGQTLLVLEAMKMEHHINAAADGTVTEILVAVGQQIEQGVVMMVIDDGSEDKDD
mgnify:FL=1